MKKIPTLLLTASALISTASLTVAQSGRIDEKGSHVRLVKNADGSTTQFKRDAANTKLEKSTFTEKKNGEKIIRTRTIYVRDVQSLLRSGIIEDGQRRKLYRIVYGYDKLGRLVAENMFDARVIRRDDPKNPNKETPLRALRYPYDAQGMRGTPVVYSAAQGRSAEELKKWLEKNGYKDSTTLPDNDPFRRVPVNPNARPTGGGQ